MSDDGLDLALGRINLRLPPGWNTELDLVSRGPAVGAYRPNLRLTLRQADRLPDLGALAASYVEQLRAALAGEIIAEPPRPRTGRGADQMLELSLTARLPDGRVARHRAVLLTAALTVVTIGVSWREGEAMETEIADLLWAALGSVNVSPP